MKLSSTTDLVVPLTEKFQPLGSLVHEDSIQMTRLHRPDLYGFLTPAHNLIRMDIGWREKKHKGWLREETFRVPLEHLPSFYNGEHTLFHGLNSQKLFFGSQSKNMLQKKKKNVAFMLKWK